MIRGRKLASQTGQKTNEESTLSCPLPDASAEATLLQVQVMRRAGRQSAETRLLVEKWTKTC